MKAAISKRLTYGNVIATLALFIALGGAAIAAGLPKNSVGPRQIKVGAVATQKLQNGAVTRVKLGNGAVTATKLAPAAVNTAALADGSVTADKLATGPLPVTLPTGATERGSFEVGGNTTVARAGISYPIMLPTEVQKHILNVGESGPGCPGRAFTPNYQQLPQASPGHACLYIALQDGKSPSLSFSNGDTALGLGLIASFSEADPENRILGFWAVTAP